MAEKRDYYEVLGVAKDADDAAIKKAYREIAKKYHPDINPSAEAAEIFKEASEAYSVLSDKDKRAQYDQFGHDGPQGGSDYLYSAHKWIMGNTKNAYLNQACTPYTRAVIDEINNGGSTTFSALTGIMFDTENISSEISQTSALYGEYRDALCRGIKGQDGWKAYYDEYAGMLMDAAVAAIEGRESERDRLVAPRLFEKQSCDRPHSKA